MYYSEYNKSLFVLLYLLIINYYYYAQFQYQRLLHIQIFSEYKWRNKLRFVRIYFETPTFDRIEKDRAAKFVDMLSAIGGTMGLLTGFSIISGVEILYLAWKILFYNMKKKKINNASNK